jgi:CDP-glucose 4,6-dehydratase
MTEQEFWQNRKVFVTGCTGLLATHTVMRLLKFKSEVFGFDEVPKTQPTLFEIENLAEKIAMTYGAPTDLDSLKQALNFSQSEVVLHLVGTPSPKSSLQNPRDVFLNHIESLVNVLDAVQATTTVRAVVVLSSDKVYRVKEGDLLNQPFAENDPIGAEDPASAAKAAAEMVLESYLHKVFPQDKFNKHRVALASARLNAVTAFGDFDEQSLIWQLAQACREGRNLEIKHPNSVRPWLFVDDAVDGVLKLAQALVERGPKVSGAWNFGAGTEGFQNVGFIAQEFTKQWRIDTTPQNENLHSEKTPSMHGQLNSEKALKELGWQAQQSCSQALSQIVRWYQEWMK